MSDLEGVLARLARLEQENADLRARLGVTEDGTTAAESRGDAVSRRNLLRGATGAVLAAAAAGAATVAGTVGVRADVGDPVVVGSGVEWDGATTLLVNHNFNPGHPAFTVAQDGTGDAIQGSSVHGNGVWGLTAGGIGVLGEETAPITGGAGVKGVSNNGTGVYGSNPNDGIGVRGVSHLGRGGSFQGAKASVRLVPTARTSHPPRGAAGDLYVDKSDRLWFCKGGSSWKQLA